MDQQLIDLYHRHVGPAFDRQLRLAAFLDRKAAGEDWVYDTETAALSFGKLKFEAPLVGSHAEHNDSWLWAWSNKNIKLTLTNRALGDAVRATVHRLGLHALAAPGFSLEPLLGPELVEDSAHVLGMILTRELGYNAYYLIPYDGGTGLAIIRDKRLDFTERRPLVRLITVFPKVVDAMTVFDHRAAFTHHARDYGLAPTDTADGVRVVDGTDELTATFDDRGRLTGLTGTVQPEAPPSVPKAAGKPARKPARKPAKKPARLPAAAKTTRKPTTKKPAAAKKPAAKKPARKTGKKR
jgi:hypothetical protein